MMASALRTALPRSLSKATTTARPITLAAASSLRRQYSIAPPPPATTLQAPDAADPRLSKIDASTLTITKTTTPKSILPHNELVFGRNFTDHMLLLEWTAADGWLDPRITPYQNLSLDPATCVLHYAFEAFEGMKAYKDRAGNVRLFRPDKNMARMNKSAARIALPRFDGEAFIELLKKFVKLDERFIPS
jgi:branched-chain amino acid aminotransferase